jgi:3-oxoadipate enol-lactonase
LTAVTSHLNHVVTGADRECALLLVHPLGADLTIWDDFVASLGGRMTAVACDLRGAGNSPTPGYPLSIDEHASDLETLRVSLGVQSLVVVGCAIGTMAAAAYAANYPASTRALVLSNPTPRSMPQATVMLADRAALVRAEGIEAILPAAVERAFLNQQLDARYERYLERFAVQDPEAYALSTLAAASADATEHLRRLRCPLLLVPGRHDVLLPIANAQTVQEIVPAARFVVMEDAAHFVPYQQPERFAELVLDFVGWKAATPAPRKLAGDAA